MTFPVLEVLTEILARDSPRRNSCISREDLSQHCRFSAALVTAQHGVCLQETGTSLERKHSYLPVDQSSDLSVFTLWATLSTIPHPSEPEYTKGNRMRKVWSSLD